MDVKNKSIFDKICRVCLQESLSMSNLFKSSEICNIITAFSNVELSITDGLPPNICNLCVQQANSAINFIKKCEISDKKLRYYSTNYSDIVSVSMIKEEPFCMLDFNDLVCFENNQKFVFTGKENNQINNGSHNALIDDKKYKCYVCMKLCETEKELVDHVMSDHSQQKAIEAETYYCEVCNRNYISKFDLKKHKVNHKKCYVDSNLTCLFCKEDFLEYNALLKHAGDHVEYSKYECVDCKCFFISKFKLKSHKKKLHNCTKNEMKTLNTINNDIALDSDILMKTKLNLIDDLQFELDHNFDNGIITNLNLSTKLIENSFSPSKILSEIINTNEDISYESQKNNSINMNDVLSNFNENEFEEINGSSTPNRSERNISEFDLKKQKIHDKECFNEIKDLECFFCKEVYPKYEELFQHVGDHVEYSKYECVDCKCFFISKVNLNNHRNRLHSGTENDFIIIDADIFMNTKLQLIDDSSGLKLKNISMDSDICSNFTGNGLSPNSDRSGYDTSKVLLEIIKEDENIDYQSQEPILIDDFLLILDENEFEQDNDNNSLNKLKRYLQNSIDLEEKNSTMPSRKRSKKKYECEECHIQILGFRDYKQHLHLHGNAKGDKIYTCSLCGKGSMIKCNFIKHIKTHEKKKHSYPCPQCKEVFNGSNYLRLHMKSHNKMNEKSPVSESSKNGIHLCPTCGKCFKSSSNLKVHIRRHIGIKICSCKLCGKGFPRKTDLTLHMRKHTGEKPYVCKICDRSFIRSDKLRTHIRKYHEKKKTNITFDTVKD